MGLLVKQRETVSIREAAELIGVHWNTIKNLYHTGKVEGYKVTEGETAPIRIYRDSVVAYVRRVQKRVIK